MKQIPGLAVIGATLASLYVYVSGFGRLFVSYAPAVPAEAISAAHGRGYLEIIVGTIAIALCAFFAGIIYPRHKLYSIASFVVLALVLLAALVLFALA